jgi:HTH-type transcriptional regulator/antitoxin HigA
MNIKPIKSQRDYRRVLKEIESLTSAKRNTPEGDRLDRSITRSISPMPSKRFKHMDQNGLAPRDLIPFIGSRNRVYEVLSRRRPLTLAMVRLLHTGLGIPAESLIKEGRAG